MSVYFAPKQAAETCDSYRESDPRSSNYDQNLNLSWECVKQSGNRKKNKTYLRQILSIVSDWEDGVVSNEDWAANLWNNGGTDFFLNLIAESNNRTVEEMIADCYFLRIYLGKVAHVNDLSIVDLEAKFIQEINKKNVAKFLFTTLDKGFGEGRGLPVN